MRKRDNETIIKDYGKYRTQIENISKKTWRTEYFTLQKLNQTVKGKNFKDLNEIEIAKNLETYSPKTRFNAITQLTHFYRWLYKLEKDERLPDCIRNINKNRKSIMKIYKNETIKYQEKIVTEKEYERLIDSSYKLIHKAMIETFYNFGCRVSELLSMNGSDVSYNGKITKIIVRDSKTKPREIIYKGRSNYLMKYYESYAPFKEQKDKPLWVSNKQKNKYKRFTINGVEHFMKLITARAGLRHITPHDFRHTAITTARKNGVPDTHISNNFGLEKDTRMMRIYDHNQIDDYEQWLNQKDKEIKPTFELLEKQKKTLEEKHEKEIKQLKKEIEDLKENIEYSKKNFILNEKQMKEFADGMIKLRKKGII